MVRKGTLEATEDGRFEFPLRRSVHLLGFSEPSAVEVSLLLGTTLLEDPTLSGELVLIDLNQRGLFLVGIQ